MSSKVSHFLCLLLVLLVIVAIILFVLLLLVFVLLDFTECLPLGRKCVSLCLVIADDHVVEDGAALNLPQVKTDETKIAVLVNSIIVLVLRIVDLLSLPEALVCW